MDQKNWDKQDVIEAHKVKKKKRTKTADTAGGKQAPWQYAARSAF